jgi:L-lactate dehydrogenase complex protein LldG
MVQEKQKAVMSSREKILAAVLKNQPEGNPMPEVPSFEAPDQIPSERFQTVLTNIGGVVVDVKDWNEINDYVSKNFQESKRIVSTLPELSSSANIDDFQDDPHLLENVDLAILQGHFGVGENGAIWITEDQMGNRALPFITQHLALVIRKSEIVPTLHQAYERIGTSDYNFGTFIAGPSKTADIEQSLVLGAHGPKSMTVFLLQ